MARNQRTYDNKYKAQAVKLAQEIGSHKAATELGIPDGAIHTPNNALSLNEELIELRKCVREQDKFFI